MSEIEIGAVRVDEWLRAGAGVGGRGRDAGRAGGRAPAGRTVVIPYQKTIPHNLPEVKPALDIVSPPLSCLDTGTIWSEPGNLYTQIVDLADVDGSRSMIAPGNSEDAAGPFRTTGIDFWVRGATHPAPLSRDKVEALATSLLKLTVTAYEGPVGPKGRTVADVDPSARYVPAIPEVSEERTKAAPGRPTGRGPRRVE